MRIRLLVLIAVLLVVGGVAYVKQRHEAYLRTFLSPTDSRVTRTGDIATPVVRDEPIGCLLVREIVRQAWLIAQRDGLGLPTRDSVLREPPLAGTATVPDIDVAAHRQSCDVATVSGSGGKGNWKMTIPPSTWGDGYLDTAAGLEKLSRGGFLEAIHGMGFDGTPPKVFDGPAPDLGAAMQRLSEMNFFSQFAAVRLAHQSIKDVGYSAAAMDVLVRGYANLGQLTSCLWNATNKAMEARSLLYASRMVAMAPENDAHARQLALWHRAYAMAMAGLQGDAMKDLEAAGKLGGDAPPDWVPWIDAYCHFRTSKLTDMTAAAPPGQEQLPAFLTYLTIEHTGSPSAIHQFGEGVLQGEPDNLRVVDTVSFFSGVSANHVLTQYALNSTAKLGCQRIGQMPGVPKEVIAAIKKAEADQYSPETVADIARALVDAGATDLGEPSWAALGRMFQDANFLNVERRVFFEARAWNVDATNTASVMHPLVAGHPYASYIRLLARGGRGYDPEIPIAKIQVIDPKLNMNVMCIDLEAAGNLPHGGPSPTWRKLLMYDADFNACDAEPLYYGQPQQLKDTAANVLKDCCPTHPIVIAQKVATDWPASEAQAVQLADGDGSPLIVEALGRKYSELKDWPNAEKYLREYLKVCQDMWAYEQLAKNYLAQGDETAWLKTMQEVLAQPDYGLDHAQVNVRIAKHFMKQGAYDKAEPYADAAAQSWAGWAMEVAADCEEHLGHWDAAETWVKREQERYGPATLWLDWCNRTGHGDKAAAARAAGQ